MAIFQKIYDLIGKRAIVLIAAVVILSQWLVNIDLMKMKTVNQVVPASLNELVAFSKNPSVGHNPVLEKYALYFRTVINILPGFSGAHGMAGYCYFYLGKTDKAAASYRQAIKINPDFFWFYYDLGLIYYKQGKYDRAADIFKKAIATKAEAAIIFMNTSKIYIDLVKEDLEMKRIMEKRLINGYRSAYELLVLSDLHLKKYREIIYILENSAQLGLHTQDIIYYYSGRAAFEIKDHQQAAVFLQKAVNANPVFKGSYYYLACSLKEIGVNPEEMNRVCNEKKEDDLGPFGDKQYNVSIF